MAGRRRSVICVGLALLGCGGQKPEPVAPKPAEPARTVEIAADTPDLSPVAAPPGVFAVGRLSRALAVSDTIMGWAGLPVGLRDLLPERTSELDRALAWDAPVEFALVLGGSTRNPVQGFVSIGLTSVDAAKQVATERGYELERLAPGVHAVGGLKGANCAIAPALGSAPARLVCASRRSELEEVVPYATRGLPNESFGTHDLDFELRMDPVRRKFGTAISSARLFAGFLIPRMALDIPRFDTAVSDATYALADEAIALSGDLDVLRVEGVVQKEKQFVELDVILRLRDKKSFTAGFIEETAARSGTAPAAFFRMPAEATSGGFSYGVEPKRWEGVKRVVRELCDSYLEHEKVKPQLRERMRKLTESLFDMGYPVTVFADGTAEGTAAEPDARGWSLFRSEVPAAKLRPMIADLGAFFGERTLRAAVARRRGVDEKQLPQGKLGRLTGPGIPAGTQVLLLSAPGSIFSLELDDANKPRTNAPKQYAIAVVPDGTGSLIGVAPSPKELAARLGPVLTGKGKTFADRPELAPLRELKASSARFTTVEALANEVGATAEETRRALTALPNHGRLPIVMTYTAETSPVLTGRVHMSVPAGVFADLPGLAPMALESFGSKLMKR